MRSKLCTGGIALLLVIGALLFILPVAPVFASGTGGTTTISSVLTVPVATPTPDTTSAVNAANNAISHAQDLLNIIGWFATILGVVLGLFSVFAIVLGFLGFRSYGEFRKMENDVRVRMADIQSEADKTSLAILYLGLGERLMSRGDTEEAFENYKEAGRLLPQNVPVQSMLGRIYSGAGAYEAAISTFEAVINTLEATHPPDTSSQAKVEKELGLALRRRANMNKNDADYNTAVQHLKMAIKLDPGDSDTPAILGGLYRRKGEYTLAYSAYEQAWNLNRGSSYALGNLASLAWYEGKKDEARMYFGFAELVAIDRIKKGRGEIYWDFYDLGLAQLALAKTIDAQKTYAIAIKETPGKVQFEAVLDNLYLLQKAPLPMSGLDDVVKMIEAAANI